MDRVLILMLTAGCACGAQAQTQFWNNPAGGTWNVPANWLTGNVPDTAAESAVLGTLVNPYTVNLTTSATIFDLTIESGNLLNINNNTSLTLVGTLADNLGTVVVNSNSGGNVTALIPRNGVVLAGTGEVRLNATSGVLDRAQLYNQQAGAGSFTNDIDHVIRGSGNIYYSLVNFGTISADVSGQILQLWQGTKTNNGLMQATGGGVLQINGDTINQTGGGLLRADGGTVGIINGTSIVGGTVQAINGGLIHLYAGNATLNGATLSGPLDVQNSSNLFLPNGLPHTGTVTINANSGGSVTSAQPGTGAVLSGTGEIVLNAVSNVFDRAAFYAPAGGAGFTNAAGHTIRGSGNIYYNFTNSGLIRSGFAARQLQLRDGTVTNNGTIEAVNGDVLFSSETVNQSPAGQTIASGGASVLMTSSALRGGTANATGGSRITGAAGINVLDSITLLGPVDVNNNTSLSVPTTITNNSTLMVNANAGGNITAIIAGAGSVFTGSGEIVLNATSNVFDRAQMYGPAATPGFTNAASHTIRGSGNIYYNLTNNGVIRSGFASRLLQLREGTVTNNGTIEAVNGDVLFTSETVNQVGAGNVIASGGANVLMTSSTLRGGTANATGGSRIASFAGTNVLDTITLNGPVDVNNNTALSVPTTITNNSTLTLNANAGGNVTAILAGAGSIFTGTGEIVLNAVSNVFDRAAFYAPAGGAGFTNAAGHTIRGSGNIYYNFTNSGLIRSGFAARQLQLRDGTVTNNGTIEAVNGDVLFSSETVNQSPAGQTIASGGASVLMTSSTLRGGSTSTSGGSRIASVAGTNVLQAVTLNGRFDVDNNTNVSVPTTLTNNALMTVNTQGGGNVTSVNLSNGASIGGTGTLRLNATSGVLDRSYIFITAGSATNLPGHTIGGVGRVYGNWTNRGNLSPGNSAGYIEQASGTYTQASDGVMNIELGGGAAGQSDLFGGATPKVLGGTLNVTYVNGFTLAPCQAITVITGSSITGQFSTVNVPSAPLGFVSVVYSATAVTISYIPGDYNADGFPDFFDYDDFVECFETGNCPPGTDADFNRDGFVDFFDYDAFVAAFEAGC
jgi:hypothetical protein